MKRLSLNINFKLPDDLSGDLNDAIEELLKYRRSEKNHDKDFNPDIAKSIYDNWFEMVTTTNRVLYGEFSIAELKDDKIWKEI